MQRKLQWSAIWTDYVHHANYTRHWHHLGRMSTRMRRYFRVEDRRCWRVFRCRAVAPVAVPFLRAPGSPPVDLLHFGPLAPQGNWRALGTNWRIGAVDPLLFHRLRSPGLLRARWRGSRLLLALRSLLLGLRWLHLVHPRDSLDLLLHAKEEVRTDSFMSEISRNEYLQWTLMSSQNLRVLGWMLWSTYPKSIHFIQNL